MRFQCVYGLGVACEHAAGGFFPVQRAFLDFVELCQFWKLSKLTELCEFQYIRILGPVGKDARRKIINFNGTKTSRSLMASRLVNKTMN